MATPRLVRLSLTLLSIALLGLSVGLAQAQDNTLEERLYGGPMLSQQERDQFQRQMREARTLEERQRIQAEHQNIMRQRAGERGFNPDGIYGYPMMNQQQRRDYHQRMQGLGSAEERQRFRQEHRQQMRQQILHQRRGQGGQGGGRMMNQGG